MTDEACQVVPSQMPELRYLANLLPQLPATIARDNVEQVLGGMVSSKTLANVDSEGVGPEHAFRVGSRVMYSTAWLLAWLESKGVRPLRIPGPGVPAVPRPGGRKPRS